jgi:hypothetical protein
MWNINSKASYWTPLIYKLPTQLKSPTPSEIVDVTNQGANISLTSVLLYVYGTF